MVYIHDFRLLQLFVKIGQFVVQNMASCSKNLFSDSEFYSAKQALGGITKMN